MHQAMLDEGLLQPLGTAHMAEAAAGGAPQGGPSHGAQHARWGALHFWPCTSGHSNDHMLQWSDRGIMHILNG